MTNILLRIRETAALFDGDDSGEPFADGTAFAEYLRGRFPEAFEEPLPDMTTMIDDHLTAVAVEVQTLRANHGALTQALDTVLAENGIERRGTFTETLRALAQGGFQTAAREDTDARETHASHDALEPLARAIYLARRLDWSCPPDSRNWSEMAQAGRDIAWQEAREWIEDAERRRNGDASSGSGEHAEHATLPRQCGGCKHFALDRPLQLMSRCEHPDILGATAGFGGATVLHEPPPNWCPLRKETTS